MCLTYVGVYYVSLEIPMASRKKLEFEMFGMKCDTHEKYTRVLRIRQATTVVAEHSESNRDS